MSKYMLILIITLVLKTFLNNDAVWTYIRTRKPLCQHGDNQSTNLAIELLHFDPAITYSDRFQQI